MVSTPENTRSWRYIAETITGAWLRWLFELLANTLGLLSVALYIYIYIYIIEHCRHFCVHISVNPFELLYWFYEIRRESVYKLSIINCFPRTLCPILSHHQGWVYCKSDAHTHTHTHICIYMYIYHHHHHVVPLARISLTLSRHFSLSFIASGRSSGLHPVSSQSYWMYVRAGRPAFARPYVGVHGSTSLMSSFLLLQQCPACLVRLTWIVFVMGGRWPYSWCFVGCCRLDLFNIARNILV